LEVNCHDNCKTFNYSLTVGPYEDCGTYEFTNTASFTTNDTGTTGSDSWTIDVNVRCAGDCTLTYGYWKTHSKYGPATPPDATWNQLPTGRTPLLPQWPDYIQVLRTNRRAATRITCWRTSISRPSSTS